MENIRKSAISDSSHNNSKKIAIQKSSIFKLSQRIKLEEIEKFECPVDNITDNPGEFVIKKKDLFEGETDEEKEVMLQSKGKEEDLIISFKQKSFKNMVTTFIHICNCIIRYTVLEIPLCFAVLGVMNAFLFITLISFMSIISVYFLLKAHEATGDM